MSKAFKCNRCSTCFDPYALTQNEEFISIEEIVIQNGRSFAEQKVTSRWTGLHLCPECVNKFHRFMSDVGPFEWPTSEHELKEAYDEGFEAGLAAVYHVRDILVAAGFDPGMFVPGRGSGDFDGDHQVVEREERAKKDGKH